MLKIGVASYAGAWIEICMLWHLSPLQQNRTPTRMRLKCTITAWDCPHRGRTWPPDPHGAEWRPFYFFRAWSKAICPVTLSSATGSGEEAAFSGRGLVLMVESTAPSDNLVLHRIPAQLYFFCWIKISGLLQFSANILSFSAEPASL